MSVLGYSAVQRAFFAGRYGDVLAQTIDSPRGGSEPGDTAFVVGALAFSGRMTEADLLMDQVRRMPDAGETLAVAACFLSMEHNRAGRPEVGRKTLVRAERESRGSRGPLGRAFLFQGLAGYRFFTADYRRAGRAARRALANAQAAQFPYAQLLANDMLGHVYLKGGRFAEGLKQLRRIRHHAEQLGLTSNAHAIEISLAVQKAVLSEATPSIDALEELRAREDAQDSYSRRTILLELATRYAWVGQGSKAEVCLEQAAPLCAGDGRALAALWCARGQLARVREGSEGVRQCAERAREALPDGADPAREAQYLGLFLSVALDDSDETSRAMYRARLEEIGQRSGLYEARAQLWMHGEIGDDAFRPDDDDRMLPLLRRAIYDKDIDAIVADRLLAFLPRALDRRPGRSLHLGDDLLLVEDRGDVSALPGLSPRSRELLLAFSRGPRDRATLLAEVWNLSQYDPWRHDPVIKTSISRLRMSLGPFSGWLQTGINGYYLAEDVEVVMLVAPSLAAGTQALHENAEPLPTRSRAQERRAARLRAVLQTLHHRGRATVSEVAREVGTSLRTASRDLSDLHEADEIVRVGGGRSTRYRLPAGQPSACLGEVPERECKAAVEVER